MLSLNRDEKSLVLVALSAIVVGTCAALIVGSFQTAHASSASTLPMSLPIAGQEAFATVTDAEKAAMVVMAKCDHERECGLGVYQSADGYHFTAPVSQHDTAAVDYRVGLPHGSKLVALMHTHPGPEDTANVLSPSDKNLARSMNVPVIAYALWANKLVTR